MQGVDGELVATHRVLGLVEQAVGFAQGVVALGDAVKVVGAIVELAGSGDVGQRLLEKLASDGNGTEPEPGGGFVGGGQCAPSPGEGVSVGLVGLVEVGLGVV